LVCDVDESFDFVFVDFFYLLVDDVVDVVFGLFEVYGWLVDEVFVVFEWVWCSVVFYWFELL